MSCSHSIYEGPGPSLKCEECGQPTEPAYVYSKRGKFKELRSLRWGTMNMATQVQGKTLLPVSLLGRRIYVTHEDAKTLFEILQRAKKR